MRLMKLSKLVLFFALFFELIPVWARDAQEILNRPTRLEEERAAWNPKPIAMEEFLNPRIPLKDKYPTIEVEPRVGGMAFWMDNRYAMVWAGGPKDSTTGIATPYIAILDTDTGEIFNYKPGRLMCYRDNRLVYETGPNDVNQRKRWGGPLGQEMEVPIFATEPTNTGFRQQYVASDLHGCQNVQPLVDEIKKAGEIFGTYRPARSSRDVAKRTYESLLPNHGFFSSPGEDALKYEYAKTTWFKPSGEQVQLDLNPPYEISEVQARHWAPFLGRYVFQGAVSYITLAQGVRSSINWNAYEQFGHNTPTFSPLDGSVIKIPRPRYMLENVQASAVFATRAGMLWVGPPIGPRRGYYLNQGDAVKRIFDYEVHRENTWISPDGCKLMTYYDPQATSGPSRMSGPLGAVLDFAPARTGRKHMAIINFCKEE